MSETVAGGRMVSRPRCKLDKRLLSGINISRMQGRAETLIVDRRSGV